MQQLSGTVAEVPNHPKESRLTGLNKQQKLPDSYQRAARHAQLNLSYAIWPPHEG
jgi:hypothetical protein